MVRAFRLYTGPDNASHVMEGSVALDEHGEVVAIRFQESAPHSSFDWHDAPEPQYVITFSGTLEFTTRDGEKFILHPGDVLIATDDVGSGHRWRSELGQKRTFKRALPTGGCKQSLLRAVGFEGEEESQQQKDHQRRPDYVASLADTRHDRGELDGEQHSHKAREYGKPAKNRNHCRPVGCPSIVNTHDGKSSNEQESARH